MTRACSKKSPSPRRHREPMGNRYIEVFKASHQDFYLIASNPSTEATEFMKSRENAAVVRLRGLPYSCDEMDVIKFFEETDPKVKVYSTYDRAGNFKNGVLFIRKGIENKPTGDAFVLFQSEVLAGQALRKHRFEIEDKSSETSKKRYVEVFRSTAAELHQVVTRQNEVNNNLAMMYHAKNQQNQAAAAAAAQNQEFSPQNSHGHNNRGLLDYENLETLQNSYTQQMGTHNYPYEYDFEGRSQYTSFDSYAQNNYSNLDTQAYQTTQTCPAGNFEPITPITTSDLTANLAKIKILQAHDTNNMSNSVSSDMLSQLQFNDNMFIFNSISNMDGSSHCQTPTFVVGDQLSSFRGTPSNLVESNSTSQENSNSNGFVQEGGIQNSRDASFYWFLGVFSSCGTIGDTYSWPIYVLDSKPLPLISETPSPSASPKSKVSKTTNSQAK